MQEARAPAGAIRHGSRQARRILLVTVLGSTLAFLDMTVVNVALPAIGRDLHAGLASLQWTVNGYALTLAGFLLLGGALGDRFGRRRIYLIGIGWFAIASLLCALAPTVATLIAARVVQGIGAALLVPGSLAIIQSTFHPEDRGRAIGSWSGLAGIGTAIGPFVGGYLIGAISWRAIFLINLPVAAIVLAAGRRSLPETRSERAPDEPLDLVGAALAVITLAGVTYALTEARQLGPTSAPVVAAGGIGLAALVAFIACETRARAPMLPLAIFRNRLFAAANGVTLVVYAALSAMLFLLPIELQVVLGFSPLESGAAVIPITTVLLVLSSRAGAFAQRFGSTLPMTAGPLIGAIGILMLREIGPGSSYATAILPALLVYGLGLATTVAPLTVAVLAATSDERAGIASATNNAISRIAGLIAVAVIPVAAGLGGADYLRAGAYEQGFRRGTLICAALLALGASVSAATVRRPSAATG